MTIMLITTMRDEGDAIACKTRGRDRQQGAPVQHQEAQP